MKYGYFSDGKPCRRGSHVGGGRRKAKKSRKFAAVAFCTPAIRDELPICASSICHIAWADESICQEHFIFLDAWTCIAEVQPSSEIGMLGPASWITWGCKSKSLVNA